MRITPAFDSMDLDVVEADSAESLMERIAECNVDIAVVEAVLVEDDIDSELVKLIGKCRDTRWILLCDKLSPSLLQYVREHVEFSIILKQCRREEIQSCFRAVAKNEQFICNDCLKALYERENNRNGILTPAECVVLALLAQGVKVKDIAQLQGRSKHTIRTHKRDIFAKLEVTTTVEAIMKAYKLGLIDPPVIR